MKTLKNLATAVLLFAPLMFILSVQRFIDFGFPGMYNRVNRKRTKVYHPPGQERTP